MRPTGDEREADIGDGRAGQDAPVCLFRQMRQDQPLPVQRQRVRRAHGVKLQAGAGLCRLHQQMHLGIVPQRLIMPHALDRRGDRLKIDNISGVKRNAKPEAAFNQLLQNLHLHRPHQLHANLSQQRVPDQMQRRILLFKHAQLSIRQRRIRAVVQKQAVFQNRLQNRCLRRRLAAQHIAWHGLAQSRHGADRPCGCLLQKREFTAGIEPKLVGLFLPALTAERLLN